MFYGDGGFFFLLTRNELRVLNYTVGQLAHGSRPTVCFACILQDRMYRAQRVIPAIQKIR